jgi:hypothetical protein
LASGKYGHVYLSYRSSASAFVSPGVNSRGELVP